ISVEALRALRDHAWPGNVRELENAIEHAVVMARGEAVMPVDLPFHRSRATAEGGGGGGGGGGGEFLLGGALAELPYADAKERASAAFDKEYIERIMARTSGNVSEAARQAGMDRSNFRRLLKKVRGGGKASPDDEQESGES